MISVIYIAIIALSNFHFSVKIINLCRAQYEYDLDYDIHGKAQVKNMFDRVTHYLKTIKYFVAKNLNLPTGKKEYVFNYTGPVKAISGKGHTNYEKQLAKGGLPIPKKKIKSQIRYYQNAEQLINMHGYNVETHTIYTYDGYILNAQRILTKKKKPSNEVVILHHGLFSSADDWLLLTTHLALPCLLSDYGFDVWLLNSRGNKYSSHTSIPRDSYEFWDFSWHEMGIYDLPAAFTYISHNTTTKHKPANLHYVGHSMGATAFLVLLSTIPKYNDIVTSAFLLGPLAFMKHCKGPFSRFHKNKMFPEISDPKGYIVDANLISKLVAKQCPFKTCSNSLLLLAGGMKAVTQTNLPTNVINHAPSSSSTKTLLHYMQLMKRGTFQMYDNRLLSNLKSYKMVSPPSYNLTSIRLPITLFSSASDWLASKLDIEKLVIKVSSIKQHYILKQKIHHFDYVWSPEAAHLIYYPIIRQLEELSIRRELNYIEPKML